MKTKLMTMLLVAGSMLGLLTATSLTAYGDTLTVHDGAEMNSYVPVSGLYADSYLRCEYVLPASELTAMKGEAISSMTMYLSEVATGPWSGTFRVFLKEVAETTISAYTGTDGASIVYEGVLDGKSPTLQIEFTTPYLYSGGNLLVGVYQVAKGTWRSAQFFGETVSGACVQGYDYNNIDATPANQRNFIPKTTFTYGSDTPSPDQVNVTYDWNYEGGAKTETNFLASATILANAPDVSARDGWTFAGWFDAAEGGNQISATDLPTDGATYYAHWTPGPDQIAAGAAAALIAAIGDVAYTDESKAKIDAARAAYNALTTAQRALVTNYATLTAAEETYAALAPCYQMLNESDITAPYAAPKAVTLLGAAYDGCDVVGIVELKLGKVNAKKKTSKVSGSVTTLDGKKHAAKGVTVTGIDGTGPAMASLEVKGLGAMTVTIGGTQFAGALDGKFHVQSAAIGGAWNGSTAKAAVEIGEEDLGLFPGVLLTSFLPNEETATVKNSKWTFAKAATVKWAKPKKGAAKPEIYDEVSDKGLIIDDSKGKTNLSGLKLTYTPKKGTFKGSFKVYALEGTGKATKLKKYTFNVTGFVLDGAGGGTAICKKPSASWPVTVK